MENDSAQNAHERRNYYRVDDIVYLEYRFLRPEEAAALQAQDEVHLPPTRDPLLAQLMGISRHIAPLLGDIRRDAPSVAKYLEGLHRKVDIITSHVLTEIRARNRPADAVALDKCRVNLSAGGVAFYVAAPAAVGVTLNVMVGIRESGLIIDTYGQVIGCDERTSTDGKKQYLLRIEFPYLEEPERRQLMRHILDKQREHIRRAAAKKNAGPKP